MSRCRTIRARCPAKVNLDLRVLGRRPDGYHEIRTRFQAIDLEDVVEVEPSATLEIRCDAPGVPAGPDNLVARAAVALGRTVGRRPGGSFRIVKRIPVGAGLGGGSSDAAAAIVLLERLWGVSLGREAWDSPGTELEFAL